MYYNQKKTFQSVTQLDFYTFFRKLLKQISFLYFPDRGCIFPTGGATPPGQCKFFYYEVRPVKPSVPLLSFHFVRSNSFSNSSTRFNASAASFCAFAFSSSALIRAFSASSLAFSADSALCRSLSVF